MAITRGSGVSPQQIRSWSHVATRLLPHYDLRGVSPHPPLSLPVTKWKAGDFSSYLYISEHFVNGFPKHSRQKYLYFVL